MKIMASITFGLLAAMVLFGIAGGIAFGITALMGFFRPLAEMF